MAGFEVSINGRIWVSTEGLRRPSAVPAFRVGTAAAIWRARRRPRARPRRRARAGRRTAHERSPSLRAQGGHGRRRARAGARRRASAGLAGVVRSSSALGSSSAAFGSSSLAFNDRSWRGPGRPALARRGAGGQRAGGCADSHAACRRLSCAGPFVRRRRRRRAEGDEQRAIERHTVQGRVKLRASSWPSPVSFNALLDGCARSWPGAGSRGQSAPEPDAQGARSRARAVLFSFASLHRP
jgi:hypothetical protein